MPQSFRFSRTTLVLLLICIFGWGFSWPVIKYALAEIPPLSMRGVSASVAGLLTLIWLRLSGRKVRIGREHWPKLAALACFNVLSWNVLSTYAVLFLPAGRAALLAYTMPLWCVPLSICWLGERPDSRRMLALLMGGGGVAVLMGQDVFALMHTPLGALLMLAAALCWACGIVLMKRWALPVNSGALTAWQLLLGGLPMLLAAGLVDGLPASPVSSGAILALVFSTLVTFMLCYWAWNHLVALLPVAVSSVSSLLVPVVSVLAGAVFLGERPGWAEFVSAALILGAVAVINLGRRRAQT